MISQSQVLGTKIPQYHIDSCDFDLMPTKSRELGDSKWKD